MTLELSAAGNKGSYWYIGMFIVDFWIRYQYFNVISDKCLKNMFLSSLVTELQYSFVIGIVVSKRRGLWTFACMKN